MKPHYQRIRRVKTHSGSTAIQVGFYEGKRFKLTKHIGSSGNPQKVAELISIAYTFIRTRLPQRELNFDPHSDEILFKRGIKVESSCLEEAYEYLSRIYAKVGFAKLESDLLKHFAIIRVLEPASKLKSIELLKKYFNITYRKTTVFRKLPLLLPLKEEAMNIAIDYARGHLHFDFSLVFYDITTLYFETHRADDFRLCGFSKDNKSNQPQILIGLVVNDAGFPIYYEIFKGKTFEGHTIIPLISNLTAKYKIDKIAVVADAGMLSAQNLQALEKQGIDYVVGAKTKSLGFDKVKILAQALNQTDKKIIRQNDVLYEYSAARARKDKVDNEKQIEKAKYFLAHQDKIAARAKFLTREGEKVFKLNEALIEKHHLLEGIKGYKTNIRYLKEELLIARYRDLWKVEQAFRIAKSDLEARPIYHRKKTSIEYHILIVFVALCMAKVIEMEKGESIKRVTEALKDRWVITLTDQISGNSLKLLLDRKPH